MTIIDYCTFTHSLFNCHLLDTVPSDKPEKENISFLQSIPCYTPNIITLELFISHKIKMSEKDESETEEDKEKPVLATHRSQLSVARLNYQTLNEKLWCAIWTNIQILY